MGCRACPASFELDPGRLFVADSRLDFAFVAVVLGAVDGTLLAPHGYFRLNGATGKLMRDEYATIVQHPNEKQKHITGAAANVSTSRISARCPPSSTSLPHLHAVGSVLSTTAR